MKNMICYLVMIILSGCTLEENIKKEEGKDYTDVDHQVDLVDYEFEQRLNSFYESEPIKNEELYGLYEGEFPKDEYNPTKLRIHWRDARELALAELELQRPIQEGWEEADVSVRPILVLDRDGGDFYRYYEYRVVKDMRFLGAIRIPAYRRTENFTTAEVHRYSDDEKTYTIHPTMWGNHIGQNLLLPKYSEFMDTVSSQIKLTDNIIYNILYRLSSMFDLESKVPPVDVRKTYDQLYKVYSDSSHVMDNIKTPPSVSIKKSVLDSASRVNTYEIRDYKQKAKNSIFKMEALTVMAPRSQEFIKNIFLSSQNSHFLSALMKMYVIMTSNPATTTLQKELRAIFWIYVEQNVKQQNLKDLLLQKKWDMSDELLARGITPIIEYPNIEKYKQRDVSAVYCDLVLTQYFIHTDQEHQQYLTTYTGFNIKNNNVTTSIFGEIANANEKENISNTIVRKVINNTRINWDEIEDLLDITEDTFLEIKQMIDVLESLTGSVSYWLDLIENPDTLENGFQWFGQVSAAVGSFGISVLIQAIDMKNDLEKANDHLNNIFENLESILGSEGLKSVGKLSQKLSTKPGLAVLGDIGEILIDYVDNGPDLLQNIFKKAFDQWVVWVIPIFLFPTWIHYTNAWGVIPHWQYVLGLPVAHTFNPDRIVSSEKNPTEVDTPPLPEEESAYMPEGLEEYGQEWSKIQAWIQSSGIMNVNNNGQFTIATEQEITSIINYIIALTKKVYIDQFIINELGEPIQTTDKQKLDEGLVTLLNTDGKEYIESIITSIDVPLFKW